MRVFQAVLIAITMLSISACENYDLDMYDQIHFKDQESPRFLPPEGSVSVVGLRTDYSYIDGAFLSNPHREEAGLHDEGKVLYEIYCLPCHGSDGTTANTPVADKFEIRPADLTNEAVLELAEGEIFQAILDGAGTMPAYRTDVSDREAWAIVTHVLKLQNRDN